MRNGYTLLLLLFGAAMFAMAIRELIRGRVSEAVPIGIMALIGFLLAAGVWHFTGRQPRVAQEEPQRMAAVSPKPKVVAPPPASPIEMRRTSASIGSTVMWAIGFFLTALLLAWYPDALWTRWLAYPVAVVALLLSAGAAYMAWGQRNERIVADAHGIQVDGEQQVAWRDVASATLVEERASSRYRTSRVGVLDKYLLLEDRTGEELLRLEELDPPEQYRRFLEAIPAWTKLPVQEKTILR
jgi:hypothetical protein